MNGTWKSVLFFVLIATTIVAVVCLWATLVDTRALASTNVALSAELRQSRVAEYYLTRYNGDYRKRLADGARQLIDLQIANMELQKRLGDGDTTHAVLTRLVDA